MLNFLYFIRKFVNVKLIKIKIGPLIHYEDSKLELANGNKGMIAVDILAFVDIIAKIVKFVFYK